MLEGLKYHLDDLITTLFEIGEYQQNNQGRAQTLSKAFNKDIEEAWLNNDVFSEVDLWSEKRIIEFFSSHFHTYDFSFLSEEYHHKKLDGSKYYIIIDPLDGTKPYLRGEKTFGISLGICTENKFLFGCNYYPAFNRLLYAFHDTEGVYNQYHNRIPSPDSWKSDCSVTSQFSYLLKNPSVMEHFIESKLGLTFVIIPDCAIYRFKLMAEGLLAAYFSEGLFIWDIGPSALLMEKIGIGMINPLDGSAVKVSDLLIPPFRQPVFLAAPVHELGVVCSKFKIFLSIE